MKKITISFLFFMLFFTQFAFCQGSVQYDSKTKSIDVASGLEGTVSIRVKFYGSATSAPIFLETMSCGNSDGLQIFSYSNGSIMSYSQNETNIVFKFKKTVSADTQVVYKFSTNGSCSQNESDMIKITVNYKRGSNTNPTDPNLPWYNNVIYIKNGRDYVYESEDVGVIEGNQMASEFKYRWLKDSFDGNGFQVISGAVGKDYNPGRIYITTKYKREAIYISSDVLYKTYEVIVNVIPLPKILNNKISISGSEVEGSTPTGGQSAYYDYNWYIYVLEGEDPLFLEHYGKSYSIPASIYNFIGNTGVTKAYIVRKVKSGLSESTSNAVIVLPIQAQDITNNTISISGNNSAGYNITGSTPVGGIGSFRYEYYAYNEFEGEIIGEIHMVGTNIDYYQPRIGSLPLKFYRKVYSGNKVSSSNAVTIFPVGSSARMAVTNNTETASSDLTVYPNPTTEVVNFATNFSTNKEIEIVVYSETIRNEKSVFKGTVTPNQVVSWNIPSGYAKGIYFYKIRSGNEEIKTGKIIVQ
ncbi:hypothetical protein Flavo103_16380 [Flavobacterium collinsii]|nr:hypothetical protein Flavo103_16380 [Flavobacterium collinsii]